MWVRSRSHDPHTGRFMSEDPYGQKSADNRYAYVRNDPVLFVDPSGEVCQVVLWTTDAQKDITMAANGSKRTWGHWWITWPGSSAGKWPRGGSPGPTCMSGEVLQPDPHAGDPNGYQWQTTSRDPVACCEDVYKCLQDFIDKTRYEEYCLLTNSCHHWAWRALASCGLAWF